MTLYKRLEYVPLIMGDLLFFFCLGKKFQKILQVKDTHIHLETLYGNIVGFYHSLSSLLYSGPSDGRCDGYDWDADC